MIAAVATHAARTIAWAIAIFILVLPALLGSLSSIAAVLLSLLLLPILAGPRAWPSLARQPAMLIFAAAFAVLLGLYGLTARDPGNVLFASSLLALLSAPLVYLLAVKLADRAGSMVLFSALCALGTVVCALVAANDVFLRGMGRATGFIMGGNLLARIALTMGFLGLSGLFLTRSPLRFLLYLGPLAALATIGLTQTRGAAIAVPALALIFAGFLFADPKDRRQLWGLIALALVSIGLAALSGRFGGTISTIGEVMNTGTAGADSAANERLQMLSAAFEAFKASPWIGYGWANFGAAAAPFMDMTPHGGVAAPGFQFHNDLANFAVAAGIAGIISWLGLLLAPMIGVLVGPRDGLFRVRLYCCLQLSAGYAIFGLTDFTFGYDLPTTLYAFATAFVLGAVREKPAAGQPAS